MHTGTSPQPMDLATLPPTRAQERSALAVTAACCVVFALLVPFAKQPLARASAFVPMYESAMALANAVTAVLLLGQFQVNRSRPLYLLVLGYLFTALLAVLHMLSVPGLFAPSGLLGGNGQTTPWLYIAWHGAFPLFVVGYARAGSKPLPARSMRAGAGAVCVLAALLGLVVTAGARFLPVLLDSGVHAGVHAEAIDALLVLGAVALAAVAYKRPRSVLDLWLTVVMVAWILEIALAVTLNGGRFDLGFYGGRLFGLGAALVVLCALVIENVRVHTRLRQTFVEMVDTRVREQSNSLLASVLRQLPQGVVILDRNRQWVMANDRAAILAGMSGDGGPGAAAGRLPLLALVGDPVRRAGEGEAFKDEIMQSASDGRQRVYSVSGAPVRDGAGAVAATVVVVDDITERTGAERALRRMLDQTRYLVENTPLAVIEWDADFVITLWNRRAEEMFGWGAAEVVGRRIDAFPIIHEDDAGAVASVMQQLADPATHYLKSENRNRTRDGRILHSEWYNSILHDEAGRIVTVFSLVLDVTERKLAMEGLQDADRRKDVYIATLAHELRNPLAPIVNAAALLRNAQLGPERLAWVADMVERQATQMSRLLDDLLDVSRIGRGKIQLHKTSVELRRLIRDALQASMPLVEAGQHQATLDLPESPVWVEADPLRLSQVLANLINNAAKYTSAGGRIELGLASGDGTARITVADNGVGIEPAMLGQVFEPFVQASSAQHMAQGGLGIGLSLAKGLVELHGGTIAVASAGPGCGSRFTITLPLAQAASGAREEPGRAAPGAMLHKTILIADDNEDAADSLALLLRCEGAQVEVAHDGEAALRMFREHPADIAVLDLGMPRMSGLEVAMALSRGTPRPFLVAVTGRGRREDRAASFEAGFDEHLTKPVAAQQLIELLQRV